MFIYKKFCVFHLVILIENKIFKCVANFDQIQREKKIVRSQISGKRWHPLSSIAHF